MTGSTVDMEEKGGRGRTPSPSPLSGRPVTPGGTGPDGYRPARAPSAMDDRDPRSSTPFEKARRASGMFKRASRAPTVIHRDAAITRSDLIASAERIFARYLVPGADKEVYLPPALRINDFPLSSHALPSPTSPAYETESAALAQVPDMFHNQKEYVFRAMEQDAFPRFLRAKAFGNLTPVSALVRLCVGLLVLWIALACAFALVFLDVKPKSKRFFVSILIMYIGSCLIVCVAPHIVIYTIYNCFPITYLPPIRTRSHPSLPPTIRNHPFPYLAHPRAICQAPASRSCGMGVRLGCGPERNIYDDLLGGTGEEAVIVGD